MDYLDFELQITDGREGGYRVEVLESPAGEINATIDRSINESAIFKRLSKLESARSLHGDSRKSHAGHRNIALPVAERDLLEEIHDLGSSLFETVLSQEVRACYRTSLNEARRQGKGLRILLRIESPEMAVLPWEYLYDEAEGEYLCLSTETPLVRYIELGRSQNPLRIEPPLQVLAMVASPSDLYQIDVDKEKELMSEAVAQMIQSGYIEITWLEGQTWRDLQAAMRKGPWHVFHFIGHGGFDHESKEGVIVLSDENGHAHRLGATQLGRLLSGNGLRLAVLNACEGARASNNDIISSTGAILIQRGIPAVVSMQFEITDRSALEFSRSFYETLADGWPVDAAVKEARKSISLAVDHTSEWATPVLHMRSPQGKLFDFNLTDALFGEQAAEPPAPPPIARAAAQRPAPNPAGQKEQPYILLQKVKQFWIEDVLHQSVHRSLLLELGFEEMPVMVESPWGSTPLSAGKEIQDVYLEMGGSLLILGEPGAGKTTQMLRLAKNLIEHAERESDIQVPVVLNLTSWANFDGPVDEWVLSELSRKYQIPPKISTTWVRHNQLILLMDGLDEVQAEHRAACVEALNRHLTTNPLSNVVVCSRFKEYLALPVKLKLNGALRLRLLNREQVFRYIQNAGPALDGLYTAMKQDSSLLSLAETPFMLSLMARTYKDVPAEDLVGEQSAAIQAYRQQLMEAYVQHQFRQAGAQH